MMRRPGTRMTIASLKTHMDRRFESQERRSNRKFDAVDKRFAAVDERFDRLTARMDARFDSLNEKIEALIRIAELRYDHHGKLLHEHDERLKDLEYRTGPR